MEKRVNKKIIDLLWTSVNFESGDGDAIWLSKHTSLDIISELIKEYSEENNIDWTLEVKDKQMLWGKGEEWVVITNDEETYSKSDWITLKINY